MSKLTEKYGIIEDPRYKQCNREAKIAAVLFTLAGIGTVSLASLLTAGESVGDYDAILGLPSYLFWSIVGVFSAFLAAVILSVRLLFKPVNLEEPAAPQDAEGESK